MPPPYSGDPLAESPSTSVSDIRRFLRRLAQDVQSFQRIMKYASTEQRSKLELPQELITAWLHILSTLLGPASWFGHMDRAQTLVTAGLDKIIKGTGSVGLMDSVAMMPMELCALSAMSILRDWTGNSDDINETYSQYLNLLVRPTVSITI